MQEQENEELQKMLAQKRDKIRELRFKDANKQLKSIRQIRKTRKEVARILTVLNSRKDK